MYNVNFKTELELYDKFRIINTIKKEKHQDVLTQLIQNYVAENNRFLENPEIQEEIQLTVPSVYQDPDDWMKYIKQSDKDEIKKFVIRTTFQRYLVNLYLIDKDNESELKQILQDPNVFTKSNDGKFLQKNGIINTVREMSSYNELLPIRMI